MPHESPIAGFLTDAGYEVTSLALKESGALAAEWHSVFGGAWARKCRMRTGFRALDAYAQQTAREFVIISLSPHAGGPPEINDHTPDWLALRCLGVGPLPDLSAFAADEFAISPSDLSWTMVHTHEDLALGGPYFILREWAEAGGKNEHRR